MLWKQVVSKKINRNHFVPVSYLYNKAPQNLTADTNRHLLFQVSVSQAPGSISVAGYDSGCLMRLQLRGQPGLSASLGRRSRHQAHSHSTAGSLCSSPRESLCKAAWVSSQHGSWPPPEWAIQERKQERSHMPLYDLLSEGCTVISATCYSWEVSD